MTDYSEPLIELQQGVKCYADAMRAKRWEIAEGAAMKIMRIGADLVDHAEAIAVQKRAQPDTQSTEPSRNQLR